MGCYHGPTKDQNEFDRAKAGNLAAFLRREQRAQLVNETEGFPKVCGKCASSVTKLVEYVRTTCCDDCRPAIIPKSEIPIRSVLDFTEPMSPEIRDTFSVPLAVDNMTFTQHITASPWLLFFTALAAVTLGKLFDLAVSFALWWYYVRPVIEATAP